MTLGNAAQAPEPLNYRESKVFNEQEDVREFFSVNPHLVEPVRAVLKQFNAMHKPCETADHVEYSRSVVSHFVKHPHQDFDDFDPFYVVDMGRVIMQMAKFRKHLPQVQPFYAVKCNTSTALISMVSALGGSFDCASQREFRTILEGQFADTERVIFANPCKMVADLRKAEALGVRYVTFDNLEELEKLAEFMPSCKAVLRIKTNDSAAVCAFSTKFGASMTIVPELLERAVELGVSVVGVSFHVGSGNNDPDAYISSILNARRVFDQGNALGYEMKLLDIGGGFPGTEPPLNEHGKPEYLNFEEIAAHIRPMLDEHFASATVIAEPGRFFSAATHSLAMNVHSMRKVPMPSGEMEYQYYVNDGLYHSFNCIVFDYAHPELHVLVPDAEARPHVSTIYGPTCDSLDCILKRQLFPELARGEWIFSPEMGSYTTAGGAAFNGFATRRTEYINSLTIDL